MTPHDGARAPPPRPSSRGHQPSFSAALLDAIYHSLEADADAEARSSTEAARRTPASSPTVRRHRPAPETSPPAASSVRSPRLQRPPRLCRVRPDPLLPSSSLLPLPPPLPPAPPREDSTGDRTADEKRRRRGRKAKNKDKVAPFACLLNALLCNRRSAAAERTPEPPASARSILSSRASRRESAATGGGALTPARRAVRFSPVAVVVGDDDVLGGGGVVGTTATARLLRDAEAGTAARQAKESVAAEAAERRVEELLRALGVPEESAKESSESSSDLFELDTLPAFQDAEKMPRPRAAAGLLARPRPRVQ